MLLADGCFHGLSHLDLYMEKCAESSMVICSHDVTSTLCSLLVCWKAWQVHLFIKGACSFCERCMFINSSFCEHILHVCSFIPQQTYLCIIFHSWTHLFACITYSSIGEPILLHVLPFNHPICHHVMFVCVLVLAVTHEKMTSNPKTT